MTVQVNASKVVEFQRREKHLHWRSPRGTTLKIITLVAENISLKNLFVDIVVSSLSKQSTYIKKIYTYV